MPPSSGELWGHQFMPVKVELTLLLPNGVTILLEASRDHELKEIKRLTQIQAEREPGFEVLDFDKYVFKGVRNDGEFEEFYDENRLLCDLRLFMPILSLQEPQGNRAENILRTEIGLCINFSLSDLAAMSPPEAHIMRQQVLLPSAQYCLERLRRGGEERLLRYLYMAEVLPRVSRSVELVLEKNEMLAVNMSYVQHHPSLGKSIVSSLVALPSRRTSVSSFIGEGLRMMTRMSSDLRTADWADFVLKVCCSEQYLLDMTCSLISYRYVQECIEGQERPTLLLCRKADLLALLPDSETLDFMWPSDAGERRTLRAPPSAPHPHPQLSSLSGLLSSPLVLANADGVALRNPPASSSSSSAPSVERRSMWEVEEHFSVKVVCVSGVRLRDNAMLMVRLCVHHGKTLLCPPVTTPHADIHKPYWRDWIRFNLKICDMPRAARITMTLLQVIRRQQKKAYQECPLGWMQLNLIDFRGYLRSDRRLHLNLAPPTAGQWEEVQQLIIPESNELNLTLTVEFKNFNMHLEFPDIDAVLTAHDAVEEFRKDVEICRDRQQYEEKLQHGDIEEIMSRDLLSELSDQECDLLWSLRHVLAGSPAYAAILPRLVEAVPWNNHKQVLIFYMLLKSWNFRQMDAHLGLQLLSPSNPDPRVRLFGVRLLQAKLNPVDLQYYLLQLTQMLKLEPYLDNPLTRYLFFNALENAITGERFFWYLRSEMHQPEVQVRFGLLLEAFCRGCGPLRTILVQQCAALDKLGLLSEHLKKQQKDEDRMRIFQEKLCQLDFRRAISNFVSPLDISQRLGELETTKCDIKKSKKRPLWLVWSNPDPLASRHLSDYKLIFKHGDDLRQDMLTLQMLRLMDSIWKQEGIDLKLLPYGCLATGSEIGLIEAVRNAATVMAIQKKEMTAALQINHSQIHRWLMACNANSADFERAVDVFRHSCAGYCVATFVLGVRDRHPDNIMVSKSGHLFHIDFGHFLNNRKKKFGINRERVPFVLTKDFIYVIAGGGDTNSPEFRDFTRLCGDAYRLLRSHADLILTLFSMMIHCGIPELQSLSDLEYIRKTLAVEASEAEAQSYFLRQLEEAASSAWKTEFDWFFHFLNQNFTPAQQFRLLKN